MDTTHARAACGLSLLLLLIIPAGAARAQDARPQVTLEEAVRLFAQNNLQLRLARARAAEAAGFALQAGAYSNPEFISTHEALSGNGVDYSETYFNLSQRIDWPGAVSARRGSAEAAAQAALWDLRSDSAGLAFEVKRAYVEATIAEERLEAVTHSTRVVRQVEASGRARFEEGEISGYELRRLSLERAGYENALATAALNARQARRRLASMLLPEGDDLEVAPAEPLTGRAPEVAWADAIAAVPHSPQVAAASASLASAEQAVLWKRRERIPDPTLVGGYKTQSDGLDGLFLGLTLPVPLFNRLGGAIASEEARARAARDRLALARRAVELDLRRAYEAYESLEQRFDLMSLELLAEVERLVDVAQASYEGGEMTLLEFLDAAEVYRRARSLRAEFMGDYWVAYFDLERAMAGVQIDSIQDEAGNR